MAHLAEMTCIDCGETRKVVIGSRVPVRCKACALKASKKVMSKLIHGPRAKP